MSRNAQNTATAVLHPDKNNVIPTGKPVVEPLYQSSVHAFADLDELEAVFADELPGYIYYRITGSPNQNTLESIIAELEGAEACATMGSGMGAITSAFVAVVKSGDHIIADKNLYGGTYTLLEQQMADFGVETSFVDTSDTAAIRAAFRPGKTKVLYAETVSNPLLRVTDLATIAALTKELGIYLFADATFSTPVCSRPLDFGADLVIHATTKYLGGHSDVLGGVIAGKKEIVGEARRRANWMGFTCSPFDAWMAVRSLKTLPLRMRAHCDNALRLACWLQESPQIARVHYPGLPDHPDYAIAQKMLPNGMYGGIVSFQLNGGRPAANRFIKALQMIELVPSLADVTTTFSYPAGTSHRSLSPEIRAAMGIDDGLLRLSVGIEDAGDIRRDLERGLAAL